MAEQLRHQVRGTTVSLTIEISPNMMRKLWTRAAKSRREAADIAVDAIHAYFKKKTGAREKS